MPPKKTRICFTSHDWDSFYDLLLRKFVNPFEGSYAKVFVSENYAVKMMMRSDPAYDHYLTFALANQNNPYVPKIFKIVIGRGFKCIVMEKLEPLKQKPFQYTKDEREYDKLLYALDIFQMDHPIRNRYAKDPKVKKVKKFLHKKENVDRLDIHNENVMKRSCGQLVITDPMC